MRRRRPDLNEYDRPLPSSAYGVTTVNYNRDVEVRCSPPCLRGLWGVPYKSPHRHGGEPGRMLHLWTTRRYAPPRQEIVRRYYAALCDRRQVALGDELVYKLELLMQQARWTLHPGLWWPLPAAVAERPAAAAAIELPDGEVVTGKTTDLMGASSSTPQRLKRLAGIGHEHHLISRGGHQAIGQMKVKHLGSANPRLLR